MSYSDKLKNPKWQRKRLEVMKEDNFTCQICEATDKTLTVHHIRYIPGYDPWEYPNELMVTLCEDCHDFVHSRNEFFWIDTYEAMIKYSKNLI